MKAFSAATTIQFLPEHLPLLRVMRGGAFSISTRTRQTCFPPLRLLFFRVKSEVESRVVAELDDFSIVSSTVLTAEKEEAKAVLTLFLKKQGLSDEAAARSFSKSDRFINHLVSRLHSIHKTWYLIGREPTTLEIRAALIPYLESLLEDINGDSLVDVVENFLNSPKKELPVPNAASPTSFESKKLKALARVSEIGTCGKLPLKILYLQEIGMDMDQIKGMALRFPSFTTSCSLEGKIKPLVEFLLDLGVPSTDIPSILYKRPQLFSLSLSKNIIPTMAYLEQLGVDKSQWAKVIYRFPTLLTCSRQKIKATVDYLYELGLDGSTIGKILTRSPRILSYSIDDNLHPTAEYFDSMGVELPALFGRFPQIFGLSIDNNLKPVTEFFLGKGYSIDDIGIIASRYGAIYYLSLTENVIPKWDFFLTMEYPRAELVQFPHYFGYSLEGRIKPRYAKVRASGVKLSLNQILSVTDSNFDKVLNRRIRQKLDAAAEDSTTI